MSTPGFEVKVDEHGRHISTLRPGASIELSISGSADGLSLPGDVTALELQHLVVRIASDVDVYMEFSSDDDQTAATSAGLMFLKGTEQITLPDGTSFVSAIALDGASTGKCSIALMS